ncbi:MAG TPA: DUF4097 family beta strand repeat-containing protein [Gammaproteobacteria bacterium]|nr:DUF4097 family beta strand repeat-containing protein [Gammaproteobacteria bacterium]
MKPLDTLIVLVALAMSTNTAYANAPILYRHHWSISADVHGTVRLDLDSQDVRMRVVPGDKVNVTFTIRSDADNNKQELIKRYKPTVKREGNDVVIASPHQDHEWHWFSFDHETSALVEVVLPPGMAVHFKTDSGDISFDGPNDQASITGRADSGDVTIRAASPTLNVAADSGDVRVILSQPGKRVTLAADSGDVHFKGGAKELKISADSGDITALGPTGSAHLQADSGDIRIKGLSGSLRAEADSGDVEAEWRQLASDAQITVRADSGDVTLTLPSDAQLRGEAGTENGSLDSDFAGSYDKDRDRLTLSGSAGAVPVQIKTESGDVELRKGRWL